MSDHPICVCDHGSAWHYTSQWGHTAVCHFGNCACTRYRPRGMWEEMQMKDGTKVTRLSDAALSDAFDLLDDMEEGPPCPCRCGHAYEQHTDSIGCGECKGGSCVKYVGTKDGDDDE